MVFATVQGDVHDIGKNIVILMLRNQGFEIIDLGKDVTAEKIYEVAMERKADIIGLSALMTTTMPRMAEFMELLHKNNVSKPVMVGGAAVTRQFAQSIGAYYAVDAVDAVRVAQEIMQSVTQK
jgi:5-methyltetrahydrofolate--homocysteine methyltransferase